jgi:tRNA A37 threonylcarbamoyladenosine synthetase subunit TsaC/SUA5/YrdC
VFGSSIAVYLDGGPATGTGSTVVDVTGDAAHVLREGPITSDTLAAALGGRFEGA